MIRKLLLCTAFLVVAFLWMGCDLLQKEEDTLSAPNVGSASSLTSFTGTVPSSSTDSKALFLDAKNALDTEIGNHMNQNVSLHPSLTLAKALRPKATQTETTPLDVTFALGGGTVAITGSETYSSPDPQTFNPGPNSSFSFPVTVKEDMTGTVTDVTVPLQGSPTYKVNGKYVYKLSVNVTISGTTDANGYPIDSSLKLSYSISLQMGLALSISASTGMGGKFVVAFPFEYAKSGISLSDFNEDAAFTQLENDLVQKMQNTTASLKVYDNANTLKYSVDLTLAELEAGNF